MHDTTWLETHGIPATYVASTEFVDAAEKQAQALGLPDLRGIFVPHPIQDRSDAEMREHAEAIFDDLLETLTRPAGE